MYRVPALLMIVLVAEDTSGCIPMKPRDFDDVIPRTRTPPPVTLVTTAAGSLGTTVPAGTTRVSELSTSPPIWTTTEGVVMTLSSTSQVPVTTTMPDPCANCMMPTFLGQDDFSTPCGFGDDTLPAITMFKKGAGTTCELVVEGCVVYDTVLVNDQCYFDDFATNAICMNGVFIGGDGVGVKSVRCQVD